MQQTKDISDPSTDRKMHDSPDISPNTPDQEPLSHDQEIASNQEQAEKRQSVRTTTPYNVWYGYLFKLHHFYSSIHLQTLQDISHRINQLLTNTPALKSLTLMDLNTKAIQHIKEKDYISAAAIYTVLFNKAAQQNLTHPELYVCRSNFSAVYLHLELFEEALQQAEKCRILAECSLRRYWSEPDAAVSWTLRIVQQQTWRWLKLSFFKTLCLQELQSLFWIYQVVRTQRQGFNGSTTTQRSCGCIWTRSQAWCFQFRDEKGAWSSQPMHRWRPNSR